MTSSSGDSGQSQDAAYEALLAAASDPLVRGDYRTIAAAFSNEDFRQIVSLAWRHQFNDDRYAFKRDLRELQLHVCSNVPIPSKETAP